MALIAASVPNSVMEFLVEFHDGNVGYALDGTWPISCTICL